MDRISITVSHILDYQAYKMDSKGYQPNAPASDPYGKPPSYEQASYPPPSQAYPPMGQAYPPPSQPYPPQSQGT